VTPPGGVPGNSADQLLPDSDIHPYYWTLNLTMSECKKHHGEVLGMPDRDWDTVHVPTNWWGVASNSRAGSATGLAEHGPLDRYRFDVTDPR
jgi:hypothetical protein